MGYEKKDASPRVIVIAVGLLILLLAFVGMSARLVLRVLSRTGAPSQSVPLPPEPRLEANPYQALQTLRAHEDEVLHQYAWVDKSKGIVRVPIDRAMDLVAEHGLPARMEKK